MSSPGATRSWPARGPLALGLGTLTVLVAVLGVWGTQAELAGAVLAPGEITVEGSVQPVQHPDGGTVTDVLVQDGDQVTPGTPLLQLDDTAIRAELAALESRLAELGARRARLEAERDGARTLTLPAALAAAAAHNPDVAGQVEGQRRLLRARLTTREGERARIGEQIAETRNQIAGLYAQRAALSVQSALVAEDIEDQEALFARGLSREARLTDLRREAARLSGDLGRLAAESARLRARIAGLEIEALRLTATAREMAIERLRDTRIAEIDLTAQRRALVARLDGRVLRAPVAGTVHDQRITRAGAVMPPATPALYVVPGDQPLIASARVAPPRIGSVAVGQEARVRLRLADRAETPELAAEVIRISADTLDTPQTGQAAYRVDLALKHTPVSDHALALHPGLPVEAVLLTGPRSPLSYLTRPVRDHFGRAFRED